MPFHAPRPLQAVVEYRTEPGAGWIATVRSVDFQFPTRGVCAYDAEGILLAVLVALDTLRAETGRRIESEHVVHDVIGDLLADVQDEQSRLIRSSSLT